MSVLQARSAGEADGHSYRGGMRTPVDVLRSVGRHLSRALGDDFSILLGPSDGEYDPPTAHITLLDRTASGPAGRNDHRRGLQVALHLGSQTTAHAAVLEGYRVEALLIAALEGEAGGTPSPLPVPPGGVRTAKGVLPLYDYDGVGPDQPATERDPHAYVRVSALSTRVTPDRDDPRFVSVTASATLAWSAAIGVQQTTPILQGGGATFTP